MVLFDLWWESSVGCVLVVIQLVLWVEEAGARTACPDDLSLPFSSGRVDINVLAGSRPRFGVLECDEFTTAVANVTWEA